MKACFSSADILLPSNKVAADTWAVVACDQYTSQLDYWKEVEKIVGDKPSSLNIIFPEAFLSEGESRINSINCYMRQYLQNGVLAERVCDGFVLVERSTKTGTRLGLVGKIDLESYDYVHPTEALIRATEGTVISRIPPRVHIREDAILEAPHVMLLIDDQNNELIEPLYERRTKFEQLYSAKLMKNGGKVNGYAIVGDSAEQLNKQLLHMQERATDFFLAVGDGNHSLAAAKSCWENLKKNLTEVEKEIHPARFALVEVVNLHSPAIQFEPIHRILFNINYNDFIEKFEKYIIAQKMSIEPGTEVVVMRKGIRNNISIGSLGNRLPVDIIQRFLDEYLGENPSITIDYIHGEDVLIKLADENENCGIKLNTISKNMLFPAIAAGGILPRKTFSMGEAYEKRYYMECRKITL